MTVVFDAMMINDSLQLLVKLRFRAMTSIKRRETHQIRLLEELGAGLERLDFFRRPIELSIVRNQAEEVIERIAEWILFSTCGGSDFSTAVLDSISFLLVGKVDRS